MKYTIDTEFIDTPTCSALISLAIVAEDAKSLYFEFHYPIGEVIPWLKLNVIPSLSGKKTSFEEAARQIRLMIPNDRSAEFWAYYGAYDWYWFCRIFGGFLNMPNHWPHRFKEFADIQQGVPDVAGAAHNALNDAVSLMVALKKKIKN